CRTRAWARTKLLSVMLPAGAQGVPPEARVERAVSVVTREGEEGTRLVGREAPRHELPVRLDYEGVGFRLGRDLRGEEPHAPQARIEVARGPARARPWDRHEPQPTEPHPSA